MSVDAGLYLRFSGSRAGDILTRLLRSRWTSVGGYYCLALHSDASEWERFASFSESDLLQLLHGQLGGNDVFGIELLWEQTEIGGAFLIHSDYHLTFSATLNRVKLGERTSDVSWYLSRILPVFEELVESWTWVEC